MFKNDIAEILITSNEIKQKVIELAAKINRDYKDKDPVLISILKGSVIFLSDLIRELNIKCSIDFIAVSSYSGDIKSSGVVKMIMDLRESIENRHVLLIEDIVDTGLTMVYLKDNMLTRRPKSFKICSLLTKVEVRRIAVDLDYMGFEVPDKLIVGYGMDYKEKYRNCPFIAVLKSEIYRRKNEKNKA